MKKSSAGLGLGLLPTFVVDPPTMLVAGFAFAYIGVHVLKPRLAGWWRDNIILVLCVLFQAVFWILGPLMYWDHPFFAAQGLGNDFMWNGYLMGFTVVDTTIPTYHSAGLTALAVFCWLIQPLFLWLGVQAAYILTGRTEHQTGVLGLYRD